MGDELQPHHALLLDWWGTNRRDFCWRRSGVTPYQMLCTEILLWKTRAESVEMVWDQFFSRFPLPSKLAAASETDVSQIIAPLGLKQRAGYLIRSADLICTRFGGEVPEDEDDLMSLPGVGPYVSSAVRCFSFGEDEAVYDANVRRIMFRMFNTDSDAVAEDEARKLVPSGWAADWNYALLDLGAILCRYKPECEVCPLASICVVGSAELELDG